VPAAQADGVHDAVSLAYEHIGVECKKTAVPVNSHVFFERLLLRSGRVADLDPKQFASVTMTRWKFTRDATSSEFRVSLLEIASRTTLSCIVASSTRLNAKAKANTGDELPFGLESTCPDTWVPTCASDILAKIAAAMPDEDNSSVASSHHECDRSWSTASGDDEDAVVGSPGDEPEGPEEHDVEPIADVPIAVEPIVVEPIAVPIAVADEPWNAAGIKSWELVPPRGTAKCFICMARMMPGTFRLDYRFRVSNDLRDQKRLHPECASTLPDATRARDKDFLESRLAKPHLPDDVRAMLVHVLGLL
jgi:hypothetical protein